MKTVVAQTNWTGLNWVVFDATTYDKPHHPTMTAGDAAKIRRVLAEVKPCQRALLRYIFTDGPGTVALYFAAPRGTFVHILGTRG
jgi:hypothetical protein